MTHSIDNLVARPPQAVRFAWQMLYPFRMIRRTASCIKKRDDT